MQDDSQQETSPISDQLLLALRRIAQAADLHSRELLLTCGLTGPQLVTLRAIARRQPVKASELARAVHLGHPTVTGILNRLERQGLIERSRGEHDRRSVQVRLTPVGERVLTEAPPLLPAAFLRRISQLKSWERSQLLSSLERVAEMMGAGDPDLENDIPTTRRENGAAGSPLGEPATS